MFLVMGGDGGNAHPDQNEGADCYHNAADHSHEQSSDDVFHGNGDDRMFADINRHFLQKSGKKEKKPPFSKNRLHTGKKRGKMQTRKILLLPAVGSGICFCFLPVDLGTLFVSKER